MEDVKKLIEEINSKQSKNYKQMEIDEIKILTQAEQQIVGNLNTIILKAFPKKNYLKN